MNHHAVLFPHISDYLVVSLDFDGVIGLGSDVKKRYAEKWYGAELLDHQIKERAFDELLSAKGIKYRDFMDRINEDHILEYKVAEGALEALELLHLQGFRFPIITSRNEHDVQYARHFVQERLKGIILPSYVLNTAGKPKEELIMKIHPRAHIDDDLSKLRDISTAPIELFYFRQPENFHQQVQPDDPSRIIETHSFDDLYHQMMTLRKCHEAVCFINEVENRKENIPQIYKALQEVKNDGIEELLKHYDLFISGMQKTIIMMHGNPLSGKSTIAKTISENTGYRIIESVRTRFNELNPETSVDMFDETLPQVRESKDFSYKRMLLHAAEDLKRGKSVILDATFHKAYRRKWAYDLAESTGAELVIVHCSYDDEIGIRKMLDERKQDQDYRYNLLNDWEQYLTMVDQADPIEEDSRFSDTSLLTINMNKKAITHRGKAGDLKKILQRSLSFK
jgi:predicted kinase